MNVPLVDLQEQYRRISAQLDEAVHRIVSKGDFILGGDLESFESEFATYCGVHYGVGVDSGASALEMALRAFDIGRGDEVITVSHTFVATVSAIVWAGASPVLVDIDPKTFNIDPDKIEAVITQHTKAILPVHLYGRVADMHAVQAIAKKHGLLVIEDACQAHGARLDGRRAGSMSNAACFSFYPGKNLGAFGDAGMVVTDDAAVAEKLRLLRNYGQKRKNRHDLLGYNRRMDNLHAAVLRVKLRHLDEWNEQRRGAARLYDELLGALEWVQLPVAPEGESHVYHLYVARHPRRDELAIHLQNNGVSSGFHYPIPVHLQPCYDWLEMRHGVLPHTERAASTVISLPIFPEISKEQIEYVSSLIMEFG